MTPAEFATLQATEVDIAEWQAAGRPAGLALVMLAKRGHTRVALARRLGVSTQMVKAWEIGRNRPVTKHAAELERMLADVGPVVLRKPDTLPDAAVRRTRRAGNLRRYPGEPRTCSAHGDFEPCQECKRIRDRREP